MRAHTHTEQSNKGEMATPRPTKGTNAPSVTVLLSEFELERWQRYLEVIGYRVIVYESVRDGRFNHEPIDGSLVCFPIPASLATDSVSAPLEQIGKRLGPLLGGVRDLWVLPEPGDGIGAAMRLARLTEILIPSVEVAIGPPTLAGEKIETPEGSSLRGPAGRDLELRVRARIEADGEGKPKSSGSKPTRPTVEELARGRRTLEPVAVRVRLGTITLSLVPRPLVGHLGEPGVRELVQPGDRWEIRRDSSPEKGNWVAFNGTPVELTDAEFATLQIHLESATGKALTTEQAAERLCVAVPSARSYRSRLRAKLMEENVFLIGEHSFEWVFDRRFEVVVIDDDLRR